MSQTLLSQLWPALRNALTMLRATLPPLIALHGRERRGVLAWLKALEGLARKAVLIEAHTLAPSLTPARKRIATTRIPTKRQPRLRLWPAFKPARARVRLLGPATTVREIWREQRRAALAARLKAALRKPAHIRLADRLDALERLIEKPTHAARRLARKLITAPALALCIAAAPQAQADHVPPHLNYAVCCDSLAAALPPNPNTS